MKNLFTLLMVIVLLSACKATVTPGSATIKSDGVKVDTNGGYHCPPGQRKKGRC